MLSYLPDNLETEKYARKLIALDGKKKRKKMLKIRYIYVFFFQAESQISV